MTDDKTAPEMMSTADVAKACDTTPRLLRQFLRSDERYSRGDSAKGARYEFEPKKVAEIKKHFKAWNKAREDDIESRRKARLEAAAKKDKTTGDEAAPADDTRDGVAEEMEIA